MLARALTAPQQCSHFNDVELDQIAWAIWNSRRLARRAEGRIPGEILAYDRDAQSARTSVDGLRLEIRQKAGQWMAVEIFGVESALLDYHHLDPDVHTRRELRFGVHVGEGFFHREMGMGGARRAFDVGKRQQKRELRLFFHHVLACDIELLTEAQTEAAASAE